MGVLPHSQHAVSKTWLITVINSTDVINVRQIGKLDTEVFSREEQKMPKYYEDKEEDSRACAGIREDFKACLLQHDCVVKVSEWCLFRCVNSRSETNKKGS